MYHGYRKRQHRARYFKCTKRQGHYYYDHGKNEIKRDILSIQTDILSTESIEEDESAHDALSIQIEDTSVMATDKNESVNDESHITTVDCFIVEKTSDDGVKDTDIDIESANNIPVKGSVVCKCT